MGLKTSVMLLLLPAALLAEEWTSASDGSLVFEAGFEGEPLPGEFRDFDVSYSENALTVSVKLAASDMGDDDMNAILHDPLWLAVEEFGEARYTSSDVRCDVDGECVASGKLELKGVSRELAVPFSWDTDGDTARLRGEVVLDRTDFDVGSGEWATDESFNLEVTVRFDIRLTRSR